MLPSLCARGPAEVQGAGTTPQGTRHLPGVDTATGCTHTCTHTHMCTLAHMHAHVNTHAHSHAHAHD